MKKGTLKPSSGPKEYYMMCVVLPNGWTGHTIFLEVKFSSLASDVKESGITHTHCQAVTVFSVTFACAIRNKGKIDISPSPLN